MVGPNKPDEGLILKFHFEGFVGFRGKIGQAGIYQV